VEEGITKESKGGGAASRAIALLPYPLILLPAALAFLYVRAFGVNVVHWDQWDVVPLFGELSSGTLGFSDLFAQHSEHRIFFPRIAMLLLGTVTKYNTVAEMYFLLACFLLMLGVLFLAFRRSTHSRYKALLFVPVAFLAFSPRQYAVWLLGFHIQFAFVLTFNVLALYLLHAAGRGGSSASGKPAFAGALASATVASFSSTQGLLVWPVGLVQLLVAPIERRTKRLMVAAWGAVGLAQWVVYFVGWVKPPWVKTPWTYVFDHPLRGAEFFLTLLGSSLFWQQGAALAGGAVVAVLAAASLLLLYRGGKLGEGSFWAALVLFSLVILASITVGRMGFGIEQALISRYASFPILAVVGVYAMLVKLVSDQRSQINTALLGTLSGLMLLGILVSFPEGVKAGKDTKASREQAAFILSMYRSQPDELLEESLSPGAEEVREHAPTLERLGYNVFSEPRARVPRSLSALSPVHSPIPSSIDSVADVGVAQQPLTLPEGKPFVTVRGWAVDAKAKDVAGGVYIDVDGELFPAFYGLERQDAADSLSDTQPHIVDPLEVEDYRYIGFVGAIPVREVGAGSHELSIVVLTNDKEGYYRPDQKVALEVR
jgi:hypothetical protein